jgi:hypothetical protein
MTKLKPLSTDNVYANYHANPYEPGKTLHIEAEYATVKEAAQLVIWLQRFIQQESKK